MSDVAAGGVGWGWEGGGEACQNQRSPQIPLSFSGGISGDHCFCTVGPANTWPTRRPAPSRRLVVTPKLYVTLLQNPKPYVTLSLQGLELSEPL